MEGVRTLNPQFVVALSELLQQHVFSSTNLPQEKGDIARAEPQPLARVNWKTYMSEGKQTDNHIREGVRAKKIKQN